MWKDSFRGARAPFSPSLTSRQPLLLIILDDLRRANFRFVRVKPDVAEGAALAQEVPALIQFDLDFREPLPIGFVERPMFVQSVFLCDKTLNVIEDRLIFDLVVHESLLQRECDRKGQDLRLRHLILRRPTFFPTRRKQHGRPWTKVGGRPW
jgi:hypothetical protein